MKNMYFVLGFVLICNSINASNWCDSVVVRADNDFVSYYDTLSPRKEAPLAIQALCKRCYAKSESNRNQIFEIKYRSYYLYMIRYSGMGFEYYYLFAYNPLLNKLSDTPFVIDGRWCSDNESGFEHQLLTNRMIEIKGNDILLRERVHNGNSYNAVLLYNIICNEKLEFDVKYCIEEISLCVMPEMGFGDYLIIKREITGCLQINCTLYKGSNEKVFIGYYFLSSDGTLNNINAIDNYYHTWIVTTSGIEPQAFSKTGSSYYANIHSPTR